MADYDLIRAKRNGRLKALAFLPCMDAYINVRLPDYFGNQSAPHTPVIGPICEVCGEARESTARVLVGRRRMPKMVCGICLQEGRV
jgi:hypothetical protein